jgi:4-oxalocrotonate tautomerase
MPIVEIKLVAGRDEAAIKHCIKAVALTIHETLGARLEAIRVVAVEVPAHLWAVGNQTRDEIDAERRGTQTATPGRGES